MGVLVTTVGAIIKVTTKVSIRLYVNIMVLTAIVAEYKWGVAHGAPNTIMVISTIGLAIKPSQSKVVTQLIKL